MLTRCGSNSSGYGVEVNQSRAVTCLFDQFADRFNNSKLGIVWIEDRGMRKQIEHGAMLDRPGHAKPDGAQEIVEFPSSVAKGPDVADRTHGDINKAVGIDKGLRCGLSCHDSFEHLGCGCFARSSVWMGRVFATHPFETKFQQHFLNVVATVQARGKTARRAKTCRLDSDP